MCTLYNAPYTAAAYLYNIFITTRTHVTYTLLNILSNTYLTIKYIHYYLQIYMHQSKQIYYTSTINIAVNVNITFTTFMFLFAQHDS